MDINLIPDQVWIFIFWCRKEGGNLDVKHPVLTPAVSKSYEGRDPSHITPLRYLVFCHPDHLASPSPGLPLASSAPCPLAHWSGSHDFGGSSCRSWELESLGHSKAWLAGESGRQSC